jgi:hypothetical protein
MKLQRTEDAAAFAARIMSGFPAPWAVAGGWALDLFLGRVTRPRADLELAIFREDQLHLRRHLLAWACEKVVDGRREIWNPDETLLSPVHEIHTRLDGEPAYALEFLLNERAGGSSWAFRRNPAVTLAVGRAILPAGADVPVLAPEIVLLFKAKSPRVNDEQDFRAALPALDASRRRWLIEALERCHPGHRWMTALAGI